MDDVTACGDRESLESFYAQLATASEDAGLQINESKCELWGKWEINVEGVMFIYIRLKRIDKGYSESKQTQDEHW